MNNLSFNAHSITTRLLCFSFYKSSFPPRGSFYHFIRQPKQIHLIIKNLLSNNVFRAKNQWLRLFCLSVITTPFIDYSSSKKISPSLYKKSLFYLLRRFKIFNLAQLLRLTPNSIFFSYWIWIGFESTKIIMGNNNIEKRWLFLLAFVLTFVPFTLNENASPSGLDKDGGNYCRANWAKYGLKTGQYHYHEADVFYYPSESLWLNLRESLLHQQLYFILLVLRNHMTNHL